MGGLLLISRIKLVLAWQIVLFAAVSTDAQRRQQPTQNAKPVEWSAERWPKWKIDYSVPKGWRMFDDRAEESGESIRFRKEIRQYTRYVHTSSSFPETDLSVEITTWQGPTANIQGPTRMLVLTPEQLMDAEQGTPATWAPNEKEQEEIRYLDPGGVKGVFLILWFGAQTGEKRGPQSVLDLSWVTY